ncbi:darcynin family protein [Phenylobacterium aquaticum]|uniref:darcynin family protein n=1 Tax=Phenylobacterium aquaticum TaxID=1763816 RepID=UPI0026F1C2A2|nr:darcynin family protein [Phenylobacterium aquaticum]
MTAGQAPVFTLFMLLRSHPDWLALSRAERGAYVAAEVAPVLARWPQVRLRFYDAEAFTGRCTDVAVFETSDLAAYAFLVDGLRDIAFLGRPYFEVVEIIPALEDGYRAYDAVA